MISLSCLRKLSKNRDGFISYSGGKMNKKIAASSEQNNRPLFCQQNQENEKLSRLLFVAVIARGMWYFRFRLLLTVINQMLLLFLHKGVGIVLA